MTSFSSPAAPRGVKTTLRSRATWTALAALFLALLSLLVATPPRDARAAVDPPNCTPTVQYDPSIPTFTQFATARNLVDKTLGGFGRGSDQRHPTTVLQAYQDVLVAATANNPRVRMIGRNLGQTEGGRTFQYSILGTPEHIASVEKDAEFYRDVRAGEISRDAALASLKADPRPAFAWITQTPHGDEPAGGEATLKMMYELTAREDCANMRRLQELTVFFDVDRNPDGRENKTRTTAFGFDPNRDLMYQTQDVNRAVLDEVFQYPSLFFIDAHQQARSYFFPPNEDPVHHEISHFSLDQISKVIGPAVQSRFNDQSLQYRNFNAFDLFVPEFGDSVPSLILGAAGMTYEKGEDEAYGKQIYDHSLAMDETLNVVGKEKDKLLEGWVAQWQEAAEQGRECKLQENILVSPLHDAITQQPDIEICGYYFKPGNHSGDTAGVLELLQGRGVHVYRLDQPVTVEGAYDWGSGEAETQTLPAGTLWVPTDQTMKHWINATLEEDPFIPFPFLFDVVNWSFGELTNAGGNGQLQSPMPATPMTEVTDIQLGQTKFPAKPVFAFSTDSREALGLVIELLERGATVFRAPGAFDAAGTHFPTGAALVDAASLNGIDLAAMAAARQTPVTGLDAFPVERVQLRKPKIAVFTGANNVPNNPIFGAGTRHCGEGNAFCELLFSLARRDRIPLSVLTPVTTTDIANGMLTAQSFTALVSANTALTGTAASRLQEFVNAGGNYVVNGREGAATLRNAGMSQLNVAPAAEVNTWNEVCPDEPFENGGLKTPGTAFSAEFDIENPLAWGFDEGGYIFRDSPTTSLNQNPVFDPTTLVGDSDKPNEDERKIPRATAAVSYASPLEAYGYTCNALNPGRLEGRPYLIDQPFGAGHNMVIGSNSSFRGWTTGAQRFILNGILYPNTTVVPPAAASTPTPKAQLASAPLRRKQLPKVRARPLRRLPHNPMNDVVLTVKRSKVSVLKRIVKRAKLPRAVQRRVRWVKAPEAGKVSMRIVNAAKFSHRLRAPGSPAKPLWVYYDLEERPAWAWRIIDGLIKHKLPSRHRI